MRLRGCHALFPPRGEQEKREKRDLKRHLKRSLARLRTRHSGTVSWRAMSTVSPETPLLGGGGCGAVRFEVTAPAVSAHYCHCTRCQRRTGTAASANARLKPGSFRILSGDETLRVWKPDGGFEKWFCGDCGSALFSRHPHDPELVRLRFAPQ